MTQKTIMVDEEIIPPELLDTDIAAACRKDPAAFVPIYNRYVQPVYRYLYSKTGNPADAEDLTAQTFLTALEKISGYKENGHFSAWLFTIARNKAFDHFRKHKPQLSLDQVAEIGLPSDLTQQIISAERRSALLSLVESLPAQEQELLRLRFVARLSYREIGQLLGQSEQAVKKSAYRLLARMESRMEEEND